MQMRMLLRLLLVLVNAERLLLLLPVWMLILPLLTMQMLLLLPVWMLILLLLLLQMLLLPVSLLLMLLWQLMFQTLLLLMMQLLLLVQILVLLLRACVAGEGLGLAVGWRKALLPRDLSVPLICARCKVKFQRSSGKLSGQQARTCWPLWMSQILRLRPECPTQRLGAEGASKLRGSEWLCWR